MWQYPSFSFWGYLESVVKDQSNAKKSPQIGAMSDVYYYGGQKNRMFVPGNISWLGV